MGRLTRREREIGKVMRESGLVATFTAMAKRGYSREFTPRVRTPESRRRFEIDWIPPTLFEAVKAKAKRKGISLRALTLTLWKEWTEKHDD